MARNTRQEPPQTDNVRTFEPLLTKEQIAPHLQLNPEQVYELTRSRSADPLPFVKIGKYVRFRLSDIEKWLNDKRRN